MYVCWLQVWSTLIFKWKKLISTIIHDPHEILQFRVEIPLGFWAYCQLRSSATRARCTYSTHISHSCLHLVSHTSQTETQPSAIKPIIRELKLTNYKFRVWIPNSELKLANNKIDKKASPFSIGRYFRNMETRTEVTTENWRQNDNCKLQIAHIPGIVNRMPVIILIPSKGCFSAHMNFIRFRMIYWSYAEDRKTRGAFCSTWLISVQCWGDWSV